MEPECEFFLFHIDDGARATTVTHEQAGYFDVGPVDFAENVRRDIVLNLEEMGFEVKSPTMKRLRASTRWTSSTATP